MNFVTNLPPRLIGLEACSSSHFWTRKFQQAGHDVKLMSSQFIKPYVKSNKNDAIAQKQFIEKLFRLAA